MELAFIVRDPARRDLIVRQSARELGIGENAAWAHVRRLWTQNSPRSAAKAQAAETEQRLSAAESLPRELLGFLLENPDLIEQAAGQINTDRLLECTETDLLARLLSRSAELKDDVAGFLGSLDRSEEGAAASRAVFEEQRRAEHMAAHEPAARLQEYIAYQERSNPPPLAGGLEENDDTRLRAMYKRFKELDQRSAQPK
jgi:hypothetical protein